VSYGKATTLLAGPCGFYGGIQRKNIRLECDAVSSSVDEAVSSRLTACCSLRAVIAQSCAHYLLRCAVIFLYKESPQIEK